MKEKISIPDTQLLVNKYLLKANEDGETTKFVRSDPATGPYRRKQVEYLSILMRTKQCGLEMRTILNNTGAYHFDDMTEDDVASMLHFFKVNT